MAIEEPELSNIVINSYAAIEDYKEAVEGVKDRLNQISAFNHINLKDIKQTFESCRDKYQKEVPRKAREALGTVYSRLSDSYAKQLLSSLEKGIEIEKKRKG